MGISAEQFKKKLTGIREISTLPQVMARIMEIVTDENSGADDLAEEISKDKSLTAKILKIVNSAYYGFYREIGKVSDAVVVLGFNEIKRLSLAMSVLDMFGRGKNAQHRLGLWNHSLACAAMSDILVKERKAGNGGAFTAGLLHDIGKAVLDQYFPSMFSAARLYTQEHSLKPHEAERILFGFDHADIGCWLSEIWNLPVSLSEAIRYHHRPEAREAPELARLVHAADNFANEFMELKNAGLIVGDLLFEEDAEFPPDRKKALLIVLEKQVDGSSSSDLPGS